MRITSKIEKSFGKVFSRVAFSTKTSKSLFLMFEDFWREFLLFSKIVLK